MRTGEWYGRFRIISSFNIFIDWSPFKRGWGNRWMAIVSIRGLREFAVGRTLTVALVSLYSLVSENYATFEEYHKALKPSSWINRRI